MSRGDINLVGGSPLSRHSMQSYILTYHRLRKREPLIALGSHQREGRGLKVLHPRYPTVGMTERSCDVYDTDVTP